MHVEANLHMLQQLLILQSVQLTSVPKNMWEEFVGNCLETRSQFLEVIA